MRREKLVGMYINIVRLLESSDYAAGAIQWCRFTPHTGGFSTLSECNEISKGTTNNNSDKSYFSVNVDILNVHHSKGFKFSFIMKNAVECLNNELHR